MKLEPWTEIAVAWRCQDCSGSHRLRLRLGAAEPRAKAAGGKS